ncbi:MAG: enoyl-CoA hydratase/isomerase family protein [Chloroflexi bacterium]|nr:enoyl-CoA hydratase/isomerase family protein [Chloroflexota bacterium]MCI0829966.1 enoyl-CoA hydratase/isomerase family protein [Chloroflexota bacterium]
MATIDTNAGTGFQHIELQRRGHVAVITLQRPDRLNALNRQMGLELHEVLDLLAGEFPAVRAVVITGAGRGFCSGADVGDMPKRMAEAGAKGDNADDGPSITMRLAPHLREIPQPVIAAVNGVAAGAGLGIALACDIRIASDTARFTSVFVKRSLVPDAGVSQILSALAGPGIAAEMAFTGRIYDAQWALAKGLVNQVFPAEELMSQAESLAQEIAANPPLAVKATKALFNSHYPDLDQVIMTEHRANDAVRGTADQTEAIQAFLEKREPKFTGA